MNKRDELRYQRATAVRTFGEERAAEFPTGTKAAELFAELSAQLANLNIAMAGQVPSRIDKRPLIEKLDIDCRNIARTARAIGLDADDSSFAKPYRISERLSETALLTHTEILRALLQDQPGDGPQTLSAKAGLRARFTAYELPADFIDALAQRADAVRSANRTNQGENQGGVENTMRIGELLDDIADTIRRLDAIMVNKYLSEPEKLHAWKAASRVAKSPRKAKAIPTGGLPA